MVGVECDSRFQSKSSYVDDQEAQVKSLEGAYPSTNIVRGQNQTASEYFQEVAVEGSKRAINISPGLSRWECTHIVRPRWARVRRGREGESPHVRICDGVGTRTSCVWCP